MTQVAAHSEQNRDVFDRLLGRKGDAMRLDPAIAAIVKFLAPRFEALLQGAGFEATIAIGAHRSTTAPQAMEKFKSGAVCVVLGVKATAASAYLICDHPTAGIISEIMLGGDPEFAALSASRAPNTMECDLVRQFADIAGQALQTTLAAPECPKGVRTILKLDDLRESDGAEQVIAFDLSLGFGKAKPELTLAVAHGALLKMARPVQETVKKPASGGTGSTNRNALSVKVPVTGSVLLPPISLGELALLSIGDVLPLAHDEEPSVKLKVKGRPLYDGSIGRKGANYAVCLQRPHQAMTDALNGIGVTMPKSDPEDFHHE